MTKLPDYPFEIHRLGKEEGGGYLLSYVDFDECVSDGATTREAIRNGRTALKETIAALQAVGRCIPKPSEGLRKRGSS